MRLFAGTPFDRPPHCGVCDRLEAECACPPVAADQLPPQRQTARLTTEKRKKGKLVTVIRGLTHADNDLPALLTQLKNHCGSGGTIEGDELILQGNQQDRASQLLASLGYKVR